MTNVVPMMQMGSMNMMPQMMQMPMMMPMMMCSMTCEMSGDSMVCKMTPMGNMTKEMMAQCCDQINSMMKMSMPVMMMCGNMMCLCCSPQDSKK